MIIQGAMGVGASYCSVWGDDGGHFLGEKAAPDSVYIYRQTANGLDKPDSEYRPSWHDFMNLLSVQGQRGGANILVVY